MVNFYRIEMKRIIVLFISMVICLCVYAESISYSYKIFSEAGCSVKYQAKKQGETTYLLVTVKSDNLTMSATPELKIRTANDDVITIEGQSAGGTSESALIPVGGILMPISENKVQALFPVEDEQIELLKNGVSKIRITLLPVNHERPFKNDKFGKKLYRMLKSVSEKEDDF